MDDQCLRCNNRTEGGGICRKELKQFAIITTCSHVLCKECAETTGFVGNHAKDRQCPVCTQPLPNVDDAAESNLRPTEEYKMSVLCGFDPTTIMECASSALSFWNYQMQQETAYQQHLLLALSKKYGHLNGEVNKIVDEANTEIEGLHGKIEEISQDNVTLQRKNVELAEACRERGKKYSDLRKGYEVLKKVVQQNQQYPTNEEAAEQVVKSFVVDPTHETFNPITERRPANGDIGTTVPSLSRGLQIPSYHGGIERFHRYPRSGGSSHHGGNTLRRGPSQPPPQMGGSSPVNIPQHRTPLAAVARMVADRSNSSASGNRVSLPHNFLAHNLSQNHIFRPGGLRDGMHATGHGGISANMKVGGSSSSIDSLIRKQSGYVPARNPTIQERF